MHSAAGLKNNTFDTLPRFERCLQRAVLTMTVQVVNSQLTGQQRSGLFLRIPDIILYRLQMMTIHR